MDLSSEQLGNFVDKIVNRIGENLHGFISSPLDPTDLFFWGYLLAAMGFGVLTHSLYSTREDGKFRLGQALRLLFPKAVYGHKSARIDYAIFALNRILTPSVVITRLVSTAWLATLVSQLLTGGFGKPQVVAVEGVVGLAIFTLVVALFDDFIVWLIHMLMHRVPLLWEFHKLHHSAEVLTPITVARLHPIEQIFSAVAIALFSGVFWAITGWLLLQRPQPLTFFGLSAVTTIFYAAGAHLRHSEIWLAWPRMLSYVLISPAQHQIHHSAALQHRDRNYGFIFAIWDWMFGSLYVPRDKESIIFGLGDNRPTPHPTVLAAYFAPLKGAWLILARQR